MKNIPILNILALLLFFKTSNVYTLILVSPAPSIKTYICKMRMGVLSARFHGNVNVKSL